MRTSTRYGMSSEQSSRAQVEDGARTPELAIFSVSARSRACVAVNVASLTIAARAENMQSVVMRTLYGVLCMRRLQAAGGSALLSR